jgi:protein phosphatase-4 regulatory subunit 3
MGVKSQMADAIKVLLDPIANQQSVDMLNRTNSEYMAKVRTMGVITGSSEQFAQSFYDESAKKLFRPLRDLADRPSSELITNAYENRNTY